MQLTRHAEARANQRGIRQANLEALLDLADFAKPVARGLTVFRITRRSLAFAASEGVDVVTLERMKNLAVVQSDDGAIITCVHAQGRGSTSYLRRDRRKFWKA